MQLKDGRNFYYRASGIASQIGRQLTLAGIAILWLLAGGLERGRIRLDDRLLLTGWLLVLYLIIDLLQYLYKTTAWAIWVRAKEKNLRSNGRTNGKINYEKSEVGEAPDLINVPTWILFSLKMAVLGAGFAILLWDICDRISLRPVAGTATPSTLRPVHQN